MNVLQYPYKANSGKLLLGALLFGGGGGFLAYIAQTNTRGLILNHLIELSPSEATIFYWVLAVVSGLFVLIAIAIFLNNFGSTKELFLTETVLIVPYAMRPGKSEVLVSDITRLALQTMRGHRFLYVYHRGGYVTITESYMPSGTAFDELCSELARRTHRLAA